MASKHHLSSNRGRSPVSIFVVLGLCCSFYLLGTWQKSGFGKGDRLAMAITQQTDCKIFPNLSFERHHSIEPPVDSSDEPKAKVFERRDVKYSDYTPCQEQDQAMTFPRENMITEKGIVPQRKKNCNVLFLHPKDILLFPGQKALTMSIVLVFLTKA